MQKERNQAAKEAEYPQYGVIGPSKEKKSRRQNGDEKMAYTAQLHHYQQTKQKIISGEDGSGLQGGGTGAARQQHDESGGESDIDDEANYSVYECPGLAPVGVFLNILHHTVNILIQGLNQVIISDWQHRSTESEF